MFLHLYSSLYDGSDVFLDTGYASRPGLCALKICCYTRKIYCRGGTPTSLIFVQWWWWWWW